MKRVSLPLAIIVGIFALLLTSSVSFAHDWRPFGARHGKAIVERHYVVHSYASPYYYGWYYDRPHRYVHRPYYPGYGYRGAYGVRGFVYPPSAAFSFSIGHW